MRATVTCLAIVLLAGGRVDAREPAGRVVKLTLHLPPSAAPAKDCRLLPKPKNAKGNAADLYRKAVESFQSVRENSPEEFPWERLQKWLKTPPNKLPRKKVRSALRRFRPALDLLKQAAQCKRCEWPAYPATQESIRSLSDYRNLAKLLAVQARLQVARGRQDQAVRTIQTGLAMARRLGEAPALIQGLVGVAIGAVTLNQVEALVQAPDAPSLRRSLQELPRPLVDLTKAIEAELANVKKDPRIQGNPAAQKAMRDILQPALDHARVISRRLDRQVAALQCIEALRLYAAAHKGKFPSALTKITKPPVPRDPVTKKPFLYRRRGANAILEAPPETAKAAAAHALRYELTLKQRSKTRR